MDSTSVKGYEIRMNPGKDQKSLIFFVKLWH